MNMETTDIWQQDQINICTFFTSKHLICFSTLGMDFIVFLIFFSFT